MVCVPAATAERLKIELIWFGSRTSFRRLSFGDSTLTIDSVVVQPTDVVRDLGVLLDSELSLKACPHCRRKVLQFVTENSDCR